MGRRQRCRAPCAVPEVAAAAKRSSRGHSPAPRGLVLAHHNLTLYERRLKLQSVISMPSNEHLKH